MKQKQKERKRGREERPLIKTDYSITMHYKRVSFYPKRRIEKVNNVSRKRKMKGSA